MISKGATTCFNIKAIQLLIVVCNVASVVHEGAETVEIVTPENTKIFTTEPPKPSPPSRNKIVDWASNDSYLQAYKDLHRARPAKRNDPNTFYSPGQSYDTVIRSTYMPDDAYPTLTHQPWMPTRSTSSPPAYGSAHHSPAHHHEYVPTPYSSPSPSLLSLLPKKLSLKLLFKVILKLVLFKMVVKFIAIICLLLFIPSLKSKETETESEGEDKWRTRQLDLLSSFIWDSIEDKRATFEEEEMKDIKKIADQTEDSSSFSGPSAAVRFLQFCTSTVDRIAGLMLGYLKRQRNERDELTGFLWEKFKEFVSNLP